jgi:serine protease
VSDASPVVPSIATAGWNLDRIEAPEAWREVPSASGVGVAVVDAPRHGARVADVVAAVAPGADVWLVGSIDDAVASGAVIVNLSWGGEAYSGELKARLDRLAVERPEILFVASAGNRASNLSRHPHYPASFACPNVLVATASRVDDTLGGASNWDPVLVHLAAPGYIIGAAGGTYSGTSYAAAHVSGAAALLKARYRDWGYAELKARLLRSVDPLPGLAGFVASGGRLNVSRALR